MDVLIVEPVHAEVQAWLAERHTVRVAPELADEPMAFRAALSTARSAILPPNVTVDASVLWHAPHLRVLGRLSAGAENIDLDACTRAGVEIARAPSASAAAEAEFVIGAVLAMLRRVPVVSDEGLLVGRELGACVVGLVGATPTTEVLARLLTAFGAKVLSYDPGLHASDPSWAQVGVQPVPLAELMRDSDAVCVLLRHFARFDGLFGERLLSLAKPHQVIASLAHSAIFDEEALAWALADGPVGAAWIDSLAPGALDPGRPLHHTQNLQATPCVAPTTRESRLRAAWVVAERIDAVLRLAQPARPLRLVAGGGRAGPAGVPEPA
jgi:phosphoglycerate dehydrogenase-like enzyme